MEYYVFGLKEKVMKDSELSKLPNIGKVLCQRLIEVGIETAEELKRVGSENAFIRLRVLDEGACMHELMALEGAVQGIRWHSLDDERKEELRVFHRTLQVKK